MNRPLAILTLCLLGAALVACDTSPTATVVPSNTPVGVQPTSTLAIGPVSSLTPTPAPVADTPTSAVVIIPTIAVSPTPAVTSAPSGPTSTPVPPQGTGPTATPDVQVEDNPDSLVIQTLLVKIDASQWIQDSLLVSPDKKRLGYISAYGSDYVMFIDGRQGPVYSGVLEQTLTFSPDSKRSAYAAIKNGKVVIVLDGKEVQPPHQTIEGGLLFSPDSQHFAYGAGETITSTTGVTPTLGRFAVLDNSPGKSYDAIIKGSFAFSKDSKRFAYLATKAGKQVVVTRDVGGSQAEQESKPYDSVFSLAFSPDGAHMGYAVTAGNQRQVIIDGQEGKAYMGVGNGSPVFSPDGKHSAYLAQSAANTYFIVLDGQEGKPYSLINGLPVFSQDSKRMAYVAQINGKLSVVVHDLSNPSFATSGQEGKQYDVVGSTILFSPDNTRLAYVAGTGTPGQAGGKQFVVVKEVAAQGPEQEGQQFDGIGRGTLVFSPDSKRLAYVAGIGTPGQAGAKQVVVLDGKESKQYDGIAASTLTFSPDSKRFVFAAQVGDKQFIVLDGKEGKQYDVAGKGGIVFEDANDFYYLAVRNNLELKLGNVYNVEQHMKQ